MASPSLSIIRFDPIYQTRVWGGRCLETRFGRERPYPNAPRTLDLDLLLYGDGAIASDTLTVPHPRMWERAFVLRPLAEIAPSRVPADRLRAVAAQDARPV